MTDGHSQLARPRRDTTINIISVKWAQSPPCVRAVRNDNVQVCWWRVLVSISAAAASQLLNLVRQGLLLKESIKYLVKIQWEGGAVIDGLSLPPQVDMSHTWVQAQLGGGWSFRSHFSLGSFWPPPSLLLPCGSAQGGRGGHQTGCIRGQQVHLSSVLVWPLKLNLLF